MRSFNRQNDKHKWKGGSLNDTLQGPDRFHSHLKILHLLVLMDSVLDLAFLFLRATSGCKLPQHHLLYYYVIYFTGFSNKVNF